MWLAPELEIFYDDKTWRKPAELDPGSWTLESSAGSVLLRQTALRVEMLRVITPLSDPRIDIDIPWAGYRVVNLVETNRPWSAWHLVMFPSPADLFVSGLADPVTYYPPAPEFAGGWAKTSGRPPRWKVGCLPPAGGLVLLAALGPSDPGPLVVMQATLDPAGTFVDRPPGGGPATALQVYDSGGAGFAELEVHAPLETRRVDSTVIGAWGSREDRLEILKRRLKWQGSTDRRS